MCVPCAKKKKMNQRSQQIVDAGENLRKRVKKQVDKGRMSEARAAEILNPLMDADRAFDAHGSLALEKAETAYSNSHD